jgi:hypothetical protein
VEAIRARCPACLRGSGQDLHIRQDLPTTFIGPMLAREAGANVSRFRRPLTVYLMDSGIPLAGLRLTLEVQRGQDGRNLAGTGRPVKSTQPGVSQARAMTFGETLPLRETSFPPHARVPIFAALSRIQILFREIQDYDRTGQSCRRPDLPQVQLSVTGRF